MRIVAFVRCCLNPAYQTCGNHECSLNYYGPELFSQRGCRIYEKTVQSYSTQVDAACIREVWFLEDGRFVEVSGVTTKYHSAYERFSTCYRTVHHIVKGRDWQDYPPEEIADAFEDISKYPFDGKPGVFYPHRTEAHRWFPVPAHWQDRRVSGG